MGGLLLPLHASAQVLKKCPGGVTLKLNSAIHGARDTLLLAEVKAARAMPRSKGNGMAGRWRCGRKAVPSKTLHGLIGVDLEEAGWEDMNGK